jgi:subtilase family serine protease
VVDELPVVIVPEVVVVVELPVVIDPDPEVTDPEVTDPEVEVALGDQYKSLLIDPEPGLETLPAVERAERPL